MITLNTFLNFHVCFFNFNAPIKFDTTEKEFFSTKTTSLPNHYVFSEFKNFHFNCEIEILKLNTNVDISVPMFFEFNSGFEAVDSKIYEIVLKSDNFFIITNYLYILELFNLYFSKINVNLRDKNHIVLNSFFKWINAKQIVTKNDLKKKIINYVP